MKKFKNIIMSEVIIILAFLIAIIITNQPSSESTPAFTPSPVHFTTVPSVSQTIPTSTPNPTSTTEPTSSQRVPSVSDVPANDDYFVEITIHTDKKTRTYEVMPDVDEDTLKHNIGWLPSSSYPNTDGTCILMGHRDTDFRILKYCDIGNVITLLANSSTSSYTVSYIEIVESNDALHFNSYPQYPLILVTCYPFHYSGSAPQKILFYCSKQ